MKVLRFLLCFFLLGGLSFFNGNAQTLTREQAQAFASEFFAQGTRATRSVSPTLAYQWDSRHLSPVATIAAEEAAPAFYAFARESGEGFVIISSDANNPRVLGYSLESSLPSVDNIPDGMRDFLTEYSVAPAQTKQSRASYDYNATSMGNIVVNLNTAPWGQHAPFNNYCYVKDGGNGSAITGCVPTAYSILMYYHKWPIAANSVRVYHSGTGENRVLGHEYDWANMLHSYSGTYTETQAHAVATLMSDMGWAYQVKYSATNTSTEFGYGEGALKLIEVFKYKSNSPDYDSDTYATVRHDVDDATWKGYIKQSLDAKLPIPYSSTTTATGSARHIYILDGYTDADYYHFNWGWSGNGNGWFLLSNMDTQDGSNYSNSHKAYFMLSPNRGEPCTITVSANCGTCGTVSAAYGSSNGTSISVDQGSKVTLTATPTTGYVFDNWTCGGEEVSTSATCTVTANATAEYVANFVAATSTYQISTSVFGGEGGTAMFQVGENEATTSSNVVPGREITLIAEPAEGYNFVKWTNGTSTVSTDATCTATPNGNTEYVAHFEHITHTVNVSTSDATFGLVQIDGGTAAASAEKTVNYGTEVTLTAEPKSGYVFKNWTRGGEIVSIDNPLTVEVTEDLNYVAAFIPQAEDTGVSIVATTDGGGTATVDSKGSTTVERNTEVTLVATPTSGYYFVEWRVGEKVVSTKATFTTSAQTARTYKAVFAELPAAATVTIKTARPTGTAQVTVNGTAGTSFTVSTGAVVTIKAEANTGYKFAYWTTKLSGGTIITNQNPVSFVATQNVNYYPNFVLEGTDLDITAEAYASTGGTATVTEDLTIGGEATFKAKANDGYNFTNWTNAGGQVVSTEPYYTTLLTSDLALTANFEVSGSTGPSTPDVPTPETYNISVSVNGTNGTAAASSNSVTEGQSVTLTEGEEVTLTATPNDGYRFVNWTKGTEVVSSANPYTFVPTASGEYMANFEVIPVVTPQYTISVASSDNGFGSVAVLEFGTSVSGTVDAGTTLTLVATPIETCKFVKWTCNGQDIEGGATLEVTASENADYVAVFAVKESYYVSISSNPSGAGEISISVGTNYSETGMYVLEGAIVTLQATANTGYSFVNWTHKTSGEEVSTDATFTITVDAAAVYVANFVQDVVPETPSTTPEDGKAYIIRNVQKDGSMFMLTNNYYWDGTTPTLPDATGNAENDKGDNYENVFICRVIDKENKKYAFVNAKNGLYMMYHGIGQTDPFAADASNIPGFMAYDTDVNKKCDLVVTEYATKPGHYSISGLRRRLDKGSDAWATMTIGSNGVMNANGTINNVSYDDNYSSLFTFEEVLSYPNKVNLTMISDDDELISGLTGAIGTFSAPYATLIPENVTVYYAKQDVNSTNTLHLTELHEYNATTEGIPANEGVILVGNFNVNTTVHMIPATSEHVETISNNAFSNTSAGTEGMQKGDYVLARGDQGIGFYQATGTLKHNKAFLRLGSASGVAAFRLVVGETTDLNSTVTIINPHAPIYDLSGRRVLQTVKGGVYIQNGKKFIKK